MKQRLLIAAGILTAALGGGVVAEHVWADGIPTGETMFYSGVLEEDGAPVDGTRNVEVRLIDDGGAEQCSTTATVVFESGRFRVPLSGTCTDAVRAEPDLSVQVTVGTDAPFPLTKLGAVPYAVEAERASMANTAAAATSAASADALRLTPPASSESVSVGLFVGVSAPTSGEVTAGGMSGLPAARALCVTAVGSPTAHVCTVDEIIRSAQLDLTPSENSWVVGGGFTYVPNTTVGNQNTSDCFGMTSGAGDQFGSMWRPIFNTVWVGSCQTELPLACCD